MERCWNNSLAVRLSRRLAAYGENSAARRLWERFCAAPDPTPASLYARLLALAGSGLEVLGGWLRNSAFYRALERMLAIAAAATNGSIAAGWLRAFGLRRMALAAFVLYLPIEYVVRDLLPNSPVASIWEEAFFLAVLAFLLWRRALGTTRAIGRATPLDPYILLFAAVGLLLMSAVDPYPAVAWAGYRAVIQYMLWFFLVVRLLEDEKDFRVLYCGFVALGAALCLHGIYQYIVAVPIPAAWVSQTEMGVRTRVFSLTGSPNVFGSLLVMLAPLSAALLYYAEGWRKKTLYLGITGGIALALLFTFSRGAWVGMAVAVVLFALFIDRRLLLALGAVMAAALVFVPSIASRLTYLFTSDYAEASAIGGRALRWEVGRLLLTENNPWLGFGLGRFGGAVAMNNKLLDETETFRYFYMDNYYLKTMVEMGYIGIAFFLLLLAALLVWGLRSIWKSGPALSLIKKDPLLRAQGNPKVLSVGIFAGLCGVLVHSYFENIFEEPYMMAYFWGLAGLLVWQGHFSPSRK